MNTFCRPLTVKLAPRKWVAAAIIAAYGVPLAVALWAVAAPVKLVVAVVTGGWLAWELHCQRAAGDAQHLHADATRWRLYRATKSAHETTATNKTTATTNKTAGEEFAVVKIRDSLDLGFAMVLLVQRNRAKFRLVVLQRAQPAAQWHRLRVLLRDPEFCRQLK